MIFEGDDRGRGGAADGAMVARLGTQIGGQSPVDLLIRDDLNRRMS